MLGSLLHLCTWEILEVVRVHSYEYINLSSIYIYNIHLITITNTSQETCKPGWLWKRMERDDTGSADRQVSALTTSAGTLHRIGVTWWSSLNIDKSCKSPEMQKVGKFGAKLKNLLYIFGNKREFNFLSEWKGYNSEDLSFVLVSDFYQTAGRTNNLIC